MARRKASEYSMCIQFSKNKTIYAFLGIHPQIQLPKNNDVSVMTNNSRKNHIVCIDMHIAIAIYTYIHEMKKKYTNLRKKEEFQWKKNNW